MSGRGRPTRSRRADLSQHFLREASARRLVQATSISKADLVIEIGAGRGALTMPLIKRAGKVVAVEYDEFLAGKLNRTYGKNAKVVAADFLKFQLPSTAYSVIGNIPYGRTTEIIRKLVDAPNPPRDTWLVVQRDVAYRLCGRPFAKESLWSLRIKPFWHLEILDRLNRGEFDPPPSVNSVFLHMSNRERALVVERDRADYFELLEQAFRNNTAIKQALRQRLSKLQVRRLASDLRFGVDDFASDLMFEQWLGIFRFAQTRGRNSQ